MAPFCPWVLAGGLQRFTPALSTQMEDTFRVRLLVPSAPGSGAALRQGLRASSRRSHPPTGKSKRQKRTHEWIKLGGKVSGAGRKMYLPSRGPRAQEPGPCGVVNATGPSVLHRCASVEFRPQLDVY